MIANEGAVFVINCDPRDPHVDNTILQGLIIN